MAFSARVERVPLVQINVTPLVDVLLVLLIIFMITAPVITHKARMDLPQAGGVTDTIDPIRLAIQPSGALYWNDTPIDESQLQQQLAVAALETRQPALHINAADGVAYAVVARVLSDAKARGLERIDFVESP